MYLWVEMYVFKLSRQLSQNAKFQFLRIRPPISNESHIIDTVLYLITGVQVLYLIFVHIFIDI